MGCFSPEQYQLCFEGLVEGFPTRVDLANLLNAVAASPKLLQYPKAPITKKLRNINRITAEESDVEKMVQAIIQTIEAASLCLELILAAHELNPHQPELATLNSQFGKTSENWLNDPATFPAQAIDEQQLFEKMKQSFNINELNELCFLLDINKESIAGATIEVRVMELVRFMQRNGRFSELVEACKKSRPLLNWNGG